MSSCGFNFSTTYTSLPNCFFSRVDPTTVKDPSLVILNNELASYLGLDFSELSISEKSELFVGNKLPMQASTFAQAYSGHQYGYFTNLGDGRAIVLGEHITPHNERYDLQFKGSGRTPYSRQGDGRAALGPMLREYIISEAMYHLKVPTTRSLAVATTGETVLRDKALPGAVLTRVASSHIRFGTIEFASKINDISLLSKILDYSIERHYPNLSNSANKAYDFLKVVMEQQISLIVDWMRVGFVHGVMNTDNMLISGETIDYGPCAFMDIYDPNTVFSSIDSYGRYSFSNQPIIAHWNLARLAEALLPLIHEDPNIAFEISQSLINQFTGLYQNKWLMMMANKLGITNILPDDKKLITDFLSWMHTSKSDYTNSFRLLMQKDISLHNQVWFKNWQNRVQGIKNYKLVMQQNNPVVIPRNHIVDEVLEAAENGDLKPLHKILERISRPYQDSVSSYCKFPLNDRQLPYRTYCGT